MLNDQMFIETLKWLNSYGIDEVNIRQKMNFEGSALQY